MAVQNRTTELLRMVLRTEYKTAKKSFVRNPLASVAPPLPNKLPLGSRPGVTCRFCNKLVYWDGSSYRYVSCAMHNSSSRSLCENCAAIYFVECIHELNPIEESDEFVPRLVRRQSSKKWICGMCVQKCDSNVYLIYNQQLIKTFRKHIGIHLDEFLIFDLQNLIRSYIY